MLSQIPFVHDQVVEIEVASSLSALPAILELMRANGVIGQRLQINRHPVDLCDRIWITFDSEFSDSLGVRRFRQTGPDGLVPTKRSVVEDGCDRRAFVEATGPNTPGSLLQLFVLLSSFEMEIGSMEVELFDVGDLQDDECTVGWRLSGTLRCHSRDRAWLAVVSDRVDAWHSARRGPWLADIRPDRDPAPSPESIRPDHEPNRS